MGWLILAVYLAGYVASYKSIMACHKGDFPCLWEDEEERAGFVVDSLSFSIVWPIAWPTFVHLCGWHGFKYK